ncbi:cell death abnormality protein 1-like isoform X2 [Mercenaria mercenaria]|uniref:cell death abnormality protein 1-like isoform X2 n=1 Tax=Mercenaria mercenaria TaxID=6596 RepID=UPI00234F0364|nr:cell death abnormality protein 1-like isoform X2 [Mercenaria mercenaria]
MVCLIVEKKICKSLAYKTWRNIIIFGCSSNNMITIPCGQLHLILIILTCFPRHINGASLGDLCITDNNCSSLANSECRRIFDCTTGTCVCRSGYGNQNGNGCDKILRGFGQSCGSAYYCNGANQECDTTTGRCACTYWYDYHSKAGECVLRTYKILGETCGGRYSVPCLQTLLDSGGQCASTCSCQSGYVADTSESYTTCRSPRWGESCQWSPLCVVSFNTSTISDDTSSNVPTCTNNICTCPPSHEHRYVNGYNLCLNRVDAGFERYNNGENCTHFSECQSFLCVKCPGAASGVCMTDSDNTEYSEAVSIHYMSAIRWMGGLFLSNLVVLFF